MNIINESDYQKIKFEDVEKIIVKPIQVSAQVLLIDEIRSYLKEMMDKSHKNIITAKYLYYNVCEYLQEIMSEYFDINPYILDDNPNLLSECYEELTEYLEKAAADGQDLFYYMHIANSDEEFSMKKFIYIRDLYIICILLKLIQE